MRELDELKQEIDRLRLLAQRDPLTGLLNRSAMEEQVNRLLEDEPAGLFVVMDVDEFRYINDQYGHPAGDMALRELARLLGDSFFAPALSGRVGGDSFAVFLPGACAGETAVNKMEHIMGGLARAGEALGLGNRLRVSAGAESAGPGDRFFDLYERADAAMRAGKSERKKALYFYEPSMKQGTDGPGTEDTESSADMKYISEQLRESHIVDGAYCQDYDTFLAIYRFLERGLSRTGIRVHLILISLTDLHGAFVRLDERELLMERLQESIRSSLRFSDIYTQYSSCQFLAMAVCAGRENMDIITDRIEKAFLVREPDRPDIRLSFSFYPLQPIPHGVPAASLFGKRPVEDESRDMCQGTENHE
ncbi:GGDEF domain-containing protein [Enterocloster asparagiformis]|uniref:GGDEF domain-containing protein n=2 Tax=Enterocloster asparagiformis TaxID=333367 RepID=UPI0004679B80|nr:GGDEF domain-containing protein [Enterocloster asparagiformis]